MDDVLEEVSPREKMTPGAFLSTVLGLSGDARIGPFMRVWTEVLARDDGRLKPTLQGSSSTG